MANINSRQSWGAAPPRKSLTRWGRVDGGAAHYRGGDGPAGKNAEQIKAQLRAMQAEAFRENYADIEYNFLIDDSGRIWEGRGWDYQSGANGTTEGNKHWVACQYMSGPNSPPLTNAAKDAFVSLYQEAKGRFSGFREVRAHSSFKPTGCPGDQIRAFLPELNRRIASGWTPPSVPEAPPEAPPEPEQNKGSDVLLIAVKEDNGTTTFRVVNGNNEMRFTSAGAAWGLALGKVPFYNNGEAVPALGAVGLGLELGSKFVSQATGGA